MTDLDIMFQTPHERDMARRQERIKKKFLAFRGDFPEIAFTRLCASIAESEKDLLDGVKSPSGVRWIIKQLKLV